MQEMERRLEQLEKIVDGQRAAYEQLVRTADMLSERIMALESDLAAVRHQ